MSGKRIVIVEDEPDIAEVLAYNLGREGFETVVHSRGDTVVEAIRADPPALVLLDLMLPGIDGIELCRMLKKDRRTENVPIVMVTARGEEVDRIVGLELGADDYITKPFSPREVVLRIKAVLRRVEPGGNTETSYSAGGIRLDIPGHRLFVNGHEVPPTATEYRLLKLLFEGQGRVLTREKLLTEAWGYDKDVDSRTVDTHVRRLRKKLGDEADRIETMIGVGYRLRV